VVTRQIQGYSDNIICDRLESFGGGPDAARGFVAVKHGQIRGAGTISLVMGLVTGFQAWC